MTTGKPLLHILPLLLLLGGCAFHDDDVSSYGRYNGVVGVEAGYGYGYGPGWYDGFYYPGSGLWAYDRGGKRHRWQARDHRPGDYRPGGRRPDGVAGAGLPGARSDGRAYRRDRPGRVDRARPARRPDAASRPARAAAPIERSAGRPMREGRNRQERPN